jgi:hypothetical protein
MHVITGLGAGGAESMLTALSVAKAQSGAAPIVVSLTPGGTNMVRLLDGGVPVHQFGMTGLRSGLVSLVRLVGLIQRLAPDVV